MQTLLVLVAALLASCHAVATASGNFSISTNDFRVTTDELHIVASGFMIDIDNLWSSPTIRITSVETGTTIFYYDGQEYDLYSDFDMHLSAFDIFQLDAWSAVFHIGEAATFLTGGEGIRLYGGPLFNYNQTTNRHYITIPDTPSVLFGSAACSPTSTSIVGNDHHMKLKFTTGATCATSGAVATVTFSTPFTHAGFGTNLATAVNCFSCNAASTHAVASLYVADTDLTSAHFVLSDSAALSASTAYCFYCSVGA